MRHTKKISNMNQDKSKKNKKKRSKKKRPYFKSIIDTDTLSISEPQPKKQRAVKHTFHCIFH